MAMKNILIGLGILIILIALFFCQDFAKEEQESVGFGNDYIEEAISDYLLTISDFSWKTEKDSYNVCLIENLGSKEDLFPLYIWAYCGEYILQRGEVIMTSGFSGPVKINYPNELSFYDINRFTYEAPRSGSFYSEDIKMIFPSNVQSKILDVNVNIIDKKNQQKAESYYGTN